MNYYLTKLTFLDLRLKLKLSLSFLRRYIQLSIVEIANHVSKSKVYQQIEYGIKTKLIGMY